MDTPNVKDKKDEERKKGGFLANLVGKPGAGAGGLPGFGGLGGAGGFGGFGGLGGLGGLFSGGGLLATKAGLIGFLLAASAVAAGLGYAGYKLFGPSGADRVGGGFSLFAARPVDEQRQIEAERAAADGQSASLDFLVKANAGAQSSEAQAVEAVAEAAQDPAADAAAAVPAVPAAQNSGDVTGNKAAKLGAPGKLAALSKMSMGATGGSSASLSAAPAAVRASGSRLAAMPSGPRGASAGARGAARRLGSRGALSQLRSVRGDQRGAVSSMGAGSTYDGARPSIAGNPAAAAAGGASPVSDGASSPNDVGMVDDQFPDPPKPESSTWATPWEGAMKTAAAAILAGVMLLFLAAKFKKIPGYGTALAMALSAAAAVAGAVAISMGNMIAGGEYGQQLQGGMYTAAGTALMVSGGLMMVQSTLATPNALLSKLMVFSGAAAMSALLVGFLSKPNRFPPWKFDGGRAPDWDHKEGKSGEGGRGVFGIGRDRGNAANGAVQDRYAWLKTQLPC